jgi:large subunit ribosomal protein L37Ae
MSRTKKIKSAGRFGTRYGRHVRIKTAKVEAIQRKTQRCIFCSGKVQRISTGIWQCKKCNKKFASHAYYLPKKEELNLKNKKN